MLAGGRKATRVCRAGFSEARIAVEQERSSVEVESAAQSEEEAQENETRPRQQANRSKQASPSCGVKDVRKDGHRDCTARGRSGVGRPQKLSPVRGVQSIPPSRSTSERRNRLARSLYAGDCPHARAEATSEKSTATRVREQGSGRIEAGSVEMRIPRPDRAGRRPVAMRVQAA